MYYVMIRGSEYAAGAHKAWVSRTRTQAERMARRLDRGLNGQPMSKMFVLNECEYDDWFNNNVAPLYNQNRYRHRLRKAAISGIESIVPPRAHPASDRRMHGGGDPRHQPDLWEEERLD